MFNQKYFILFLVYTAISCIYASSLLVGRFISCTNSLKTCSMSGGQTVLCVLVFIEAVIFGLFTIIMLYDQLSAIFENTPGIDQLQNRVGVKRGKYESLLDVFGEPFSWRWWLPLDLPRKIRDDFARELETMDEPAVTALEREVQARKRVAEVEATMQLRASQEAVERALAQHAPAYAPVDGEDQYDSSDDDGSDAYDKLASYTGSSTLASRGGTLNAPIVFPSGRAPPESLRQRPLQHVSQASQQRDTDNPLLAQLQSPPHSPQMQPMSAPPRKLD